MVLFAYFLVILVMSSPFILWATVLITNAVSVNNARKIEINNKTNPGVLLEVLSKKENKDV